MQIKLVSITQPLIEDLTPEEFIVYCARVSNPSNQLNTETAPNLLRYCINHNHWSIFEQVNMTVEIETSRAVSAQIIRHKSFSFQEWSQRYSETNEFERVELRRQGKTNRQVGDEEFDPILVYGEDSRYHFTASGAISTLLTQCQQLYQQLIDAGTAKECARMILPMCTRTRLYMTGSVRSWIHYLQLRTTQDTQKEHREVAEAIKGIFIEKFPCISETLWT